MNTEKLKLLESGADARALKKIRERKVHIGRMPIFEIFFREFNS